MGDKTQAEYFLYTYAVGHWCVIRTKDRAVMFDGPRDEAVKRLAELSVSGGDGNG